VSTGTPGTPEIKRRVVITGAGLVSPLGDTPAALSAALLAGQSGLKPITLFPTAGLPCHQAGEIPGFDPQAELGDRNLRPLDRVGRLVIVAARRALADGGWTPELCARHEVGLVLGTMFCGIHTIAEFDRRGLTRGPSYASPLEFANSVINAAAGQTAIWHDLRGVNSTIAGGSASGLQAISYAAGLIRTGRAEVLLAGGAEELSEEAFVGFCRTGRLCGSHDGAVDGAGEAPVPFAARRNGFALAEGAALVVLEEAEAATARGARILAEVAGAGEAFDPTRGHGGPAGARAVERAVRKALDAAGATPAETGFLSASANGSVAGDRAEARGVAAVWGARAGELPVTAVKSMLGEALGASGALQVVAALSTLADGRLPGVAQLDEPEPGLPLRPLAQSREIAARRALVTGQGFDGPCCTLVLSAPSNRRKP
jgi:3-oxoacyl-[acyl-carrier-protein] synthase II